MEKIKNKKSVKYGIIILLISQIFIKLTGLIYKLYLTNKEGFGDIGNAIYSSGFQIYALLLTVSSTGVPSAISKLVSEKIAIGDYKNSYRIFKIALYAFSCIGILGSSLLFLYAKIIAQKLILIPEAELSLICLAPSIFFVSIGSVYRGYFNGREDYELSAKSQGIEQFFKTIFTIVFVELIILLVGKKTSKMAAIANLATTLATIVSFLYSFIYYKWNRKLIIKEIQSTTYKKIKILEIIKKIINVSLPISMSSLISSLNKNIDSITVIRFLKDFMDKEMAQKQYGILSGKVDVLCNLAFSFNIAFITTLIPTISKAMARNDIKELKKKSTYYLGISFFIGFFIFLILFLFSDQIFNLLFPNANMGGILLKYNSISIVFMLLAQTTNSILQGLGKVKIPAISFGIGVLMKALCNIALIRIEKIGIFGAIIGNIICNVIAFFISILCLNKALHDEIN